MTIPDPLAELRALLLADDDVAALVSERVFVAGLDEATQDAMPQAAIIVKPAGGPGRAKFMLTRRNRVDVISYGPNIEDSWRVHCAAREALENFSRNGSLFSAEITSDGVTGIDPTTQWPTTFASYSVLSSIEA